MMGANSSVSLSVNPSATSATGTDAWAVLQQLLCGQAAAADGLANALRVDAYGHSTFGRTDALDLFAGCPLVLSGQAQVLVSPRAIAVIDDMANGRTVGAIADLIDGVVARLWVVAATAKDATAEPAVAVARDDFMSQLRPHCLGDPADHPGLHAGAWPHIAELGWATLGASGASGASGAVGALEAPPVASSSQVWVMRAFCSGERVAALYRMRIHAATPARQARKAHERLALAVAHACGCSPEAGAYRRLAVSDPLPEPASVLF